MLHISINQSINQSKPFTGYQRYIEHGLATWCSGNAFHPINEATLRQAQLLLWWQVNHLGM